MHTLSEPATPPRAFGRWTVPPYSQTAVDRNVWTRAWLLLDVSKTGTVTRLKVLNAPGFDLDEIAIREAWKLAFVPARDQSDRAMEALVLWTFEWPESWWLSRVGYDVRRLPDRVTSVPCRDSGPTLDTYRDCTLPALGKAISQPWIDRPAPRPGSDEAHFGQ
jgi:hypothetical protein